MQLKSTSVRYGTVAIALHWLSAIVVLGVLLTGLRLADLADDAGRTALLRLHALGGTLILLLTFARLGWWLRADRRPEPSASIPRWQALASRTVHFLFYPVLIGMAATGIAMMTLSGAGDVLSGAVPGPLPDFDQFAPRAPHGIGSRILMLLIALHVGAALFHQFVLSDRLLRRMWF